MILHIRYLALPLFLAQAACDMVGGTLSGTVTGALRGVVIDKSSGQPIEGAHVVTKWEGDIWSPAHSQSVCFHIETATTDKNGRYLIPVVAPAPLGVLNSYPTLAGVHKEGYREILYGDSHTPGFEPAPDGTTYLIPVTGHLKDKMFEYSIEQRLRYLSKWNSRVSCSYSEDRAAFPTYLAVYREAKSIARSAHDLQITQSICKWMARSAIAPDDNLSTVESERLVSAYLNQKFPECISQIDDSRERAFKDAILGKVETPRHGGSRIAVDVITPNTHQARVDANARRNTTPFPSKSPERKPTARTDLNLAEQMLQAGFSPNIAYTDRNSSMSIQVPILSMAIRHGNVDAVELFLKYGANPEELDSKDNQPLFHAVFATNIEDSTALQIIELLKQAGADINRTIYPKRTRSPLIVQAVEKNHTAAIRRLITAGADVNVASPISLNKGDAALHLAFHGTSSRDGLELAKQLVAAGADVHMPGRSGNTALMAAAERGNFMAVKFLLEKGANINAANDYGETVIMYAVRNAHINSSGIAPTDVNISDPISYYEYPKHIKGESDSESTPRAELVQLLLDKGADRYARDNKGQNALEFAKLPYINASRDVLDVLEVSQPQ